MPPRPVRVAIFCRVELDGDDACCRIGERFSVGGVDLSPGGGADSRRTEKGALIFNVLTHTAHLTYFSLNAPSDYRTLKVSPLDRPRTSREFEDIKTLFPLVLEFKCPT
jgi:hypothetical protein